MVFCIEEFDVERAESGKRPPTVGSDHGGERRHQFF
jgi:hypothetical protein